ncbi:MAG: hypothetical protein ACREDR_47005 [Blastocatellia bacterium]
MATVDLNAIATAAITNLQTAINNLNALKRQPGADLAKFTVQIEALEDRQADLRTLALTSIENSPENQQAIAAINGTANQLQTEAGNITSVANALNTVAQVATCAADLFSALGKFAA